jgi:hypothetical protein
LQDKATFYGLNALSLSSLTCYEFISSGREWRSRCIVLAWNPHRYKNPYPEVDIMTPEEFGEIGEDYDDGEYSCKTLVPLPRSCHLWCSIILWSRALLSAGNPMLHAQDMLSLIL